ncbi:MAG TPA: RusA family crossover junction endodeoxyribonuclease [Thermoanaerobaculia bacterium]|nr:RusA family crossover junction endodeoxyribonuclease [Thermoanaerobaculia bacterium]
MIAPLVIKILGEPVPQNVGKVGRWRSKDGREGTTIRQPSKVRHYKIEVQERMVLAAVDAGRRMSDQGTFFGEVPLRLEILAVFELPKSRHRKRNSLGRTPHTGRYGNCDNLTKAIADAGEHVLWMDDGQICELRVSKWWGAQGEAPFVEIRVSVVGAQGTLFREMTHA